MSESTPPAWCHDVTDRPGAGVPTAGVPIADVPTADVFVTAATYAGAVLRDERVGAVWTQPSALARMDVGAVAGHLFLVVRRVDKRLAAAPLGPAGGARPRRQFPTVAVREPADLDDDVHRQVRADGQHVAAWGWADVCRAYDERVGRIGQRVAGRVPDVVMFGDEAIAMDEYLASRVTEVLVHADDLAASAGFDAPSPPTEATDAALAYLFGAARRAYGDVPVLRAFTRRERVERWMPSVY